MTLTANKGNRRKPPNRAKAVKKFPNGKSLKLALAEQFADIGKTEEAIQLSKSMQKENFPDRDSYIMLSQIYMHLMHWKDSESAIAQAEKLAVRPEEKEYVQFLAGSIYERQKKHEQAETGIPPCAAAERKSMALNYQGYMVADHNSHLGEALMLVKKALDLDPQNYNYIDSLGWVYFKLGNYDQAEEPASRCGQGSNDAIHDHLGELYARISALTGCGPTWGGRGMSGINLFFLMLTRKTFPA